MVPLDSTFASSSVANCRVALLEPVLKVTSTSHLPPLGLPSMKSPDLTSISNATVSSLATATVLLKLNFAVSPSNK